MFAFFWSYFKTKVKHENFTSLLLCYEPLFSPLMTLQAFCPKHSSLGIYHIPHWNTFVFVCAHCPVLLNNSWTVMVKTYLFSHKYAWGGYREKKGAHKKRARSKLTTSLKLFSVVRRKHYIREIYNVDYLIGQCSVDHT